MSAKMTDLSFDDKVTIVAMFMDVSFCLLQETKESFTEENQHEFENRIFDNIGIVINMMSSGEHDFNAIRDGAMELLEKKSNEQEKPERNIVQIANEIINPKKLS